MRVFYMVLVCYYECCKSDSVVVRSWVLVLYSRGRDFEGRLREVLI